MRRNTPRREVVRRGCAAAGLEMAISDGGSLGALWLMGEPPPAPANAGVRLGSSLALKVRATDGSGSIHTAQATHVLPDGASWCHTIHGTIL